MVMAFRLSTGIANEMMGISGNNFRDLLNNGWIRIYTGSQPASADYTETGTLLCIVSSTQGTAVDDGLKFGTSASGVLPITTPAWEGKAVAAGVAGWFRLYGSNGTMGSMGSSNTAIRVDGAIGVSGAELNLSNTTFAVDAVVSITSGNVTQPKE
jgi:hypothetical protein